MAVEGLFFFVFTLTRSYYVHTLQVQESYIGALHVYSSVYVRYTYVGYCKKRVESEGEGEDW